MNATTTSSPPGRTALISAAGLALAVLAEACSVGLLGLSGWFIASSAVAGASVYTTFALYSPSGGVRAFAVARILTNYASRVTLHSAALRRVAAARLAFYDRTAAAPTAHGAWSGQSLDRVMADADTTGMALIQATAPMVVAAAMTAGGCLVIAIDRAFLREAGLWLLDEPTAHLDPDAEARVIDALRAATRGRTVIVATHSAALARAAGTVFTITGRTVQPAREVIPA